MQYNKLAVLFVALLGTSLAQRHEQPIARKQYYDESGRNDHAESIVQDNQLNEQSSVFVVDETVRNPTVKILNLQENDTYLDASQPVTITWEAPKDPAYGHVNVDVVDRCGGLLNAPVPIAYGVPVEQGQVQWEAPCYLWPDKPCYQVRVWSMYQPTAADDGTGVGGTQQWLSVKNDREDACYAFRVLPTDEPLIPGQPYDIKWTYNPVNTHPDRVNIALYKQEAQGGDDSKVTRVESVAENVPCAAGTYTWKVPESLPVGDGCKYWVQVEGGGQVAKAAPGQSLGYASNYGANSPAIIPQQPPVEVNTATTTIADDNEEKSGAVKSEGLSAGSASSVLTVLAIVLVALFY